MSTPKLDIEDFDYFSDLQSYKCPIERGFKISAWMRQSSATSNTLWACVIFLGKSLYKDILFLCPQWGSSPYISRNFLIWTHFVNRHLEKKRTYACTFPVQRTEINVVKVRFTMRYSSRKLSHEKVITTACNFWRQIACSFLVKSGNVLLLGKKSFETLPIFQTRPGDLGKKVHACSLRFSALNMQPFNFLSCMREIFPATEAIRKPSSKLG